MGFGVILPFLGHLVPFPGSVKIRRIRPSSGDLRGSRISSQDFPRCRAISPWQGVPQSRELPGVFLKDPLGRKPWKKNKQKRNLSKTEESTGFDQISRFSGLGFSFEHQSRKKRYRLYRLALGHESHGVLVLVRGCLCPVLSCYWSQCFANWFSDGSQECRPRSEIIWDVLNHFSLDWCDVRHRWFSGGRMAAERKVREILVFVAAELLNFASFWQLTAH